MTRPSPSTAYGRQRPDTFERFYLQHVSINEGCGCAELLVRNFERKGDGLGDGQARYLSPPGLFQRLRALLRR
jgi:hypothetical protein